MVPVHVSSAAKVVSATLQDGYCQHDSGALFELSEDLSYLRDLLHPLASWLAAHVPEESRL